MEFITKNHVNTTTQFTLSENTALASRLLTRDETDQYQTSNFADDNTTASITITFDTTTNVSRLALIGINLKSFTIFYNATTANTFSLTSTGATTTSDWSTNSETSMYLHATTAAVSSITIDMKTTISANAQKAVSHIYLADTKLDFASLPSAKDYKVNIKSEEVQHKLSDGGVRVNVKDRKQQVDLKLKYITSAFRDNLKSVFDEADEFGFVAFGTSTSWDKIFFQTAWLGDFGFYKFSDNNDSAGFEGTIRLREI